MAEQLPTNLGRVATWVKLHLIDISIVIGLFSITVALRLSVMLRFPIEVGIDGAYYSLNVFTLINGGYLYYDAPVFSFAVSAAFSLLYQDIILGVKVASAFFAGLLNVGVFFAARSFTGGDWRAGLVAGALCIVDVSQFIWVTSFLKNEAALALIPFALTFFYRYRASGRRRIDFLGFAVTGTLVALSHLMAAILLIAALLVFAGYDFLKLLWQREWRKSLFEVTLPLLLGGIIFLGTYMVCDLVIPAADTWYTSSSLAKASSYTRAFDVYGVINLLVFLFGRQLPTYIIEWDLWFHLGVMVLIGLGVLTCLARNKPGDRAALSLLFSCIIVGLVAGSWYWRFQIMYFVPAYIVLSVGLVGLVDGIIGTIARFWGRFARRRHIRQALGLGMVVIVLAGILWIAAPRFVDTTENYIEPFASPDDLASIDALPNVLPPDSKLYAPHGLEYFITSRTWLEAAPGGNRNYFPVMAAQTMYIEENQTGRPTFFVVHPWYQYYWGSYTPANDLMQLLTMCDSDLFEDNLTLTVFTNRPLTNIRFELKSYADRETMREGALALVGGNIWNTFITTADFPEGICRLRLTPFPQQSSDEILEIIIYHFDNIGAPQVLLSSLVQLVAPAGSYLVYRVNTEVADAIDLANRDLSWLRLQTTLEPEEYYMLPLTPLFFLPQINGLSNFFLLLVLCPITGLYWLGLGTLLPLTLRKLFQHIARNLRKSTTSTNQPTLVRKQHLNFSSE